MGTSSCKRRPEGAGREKYGRKVSRGGKNAKKKSGGGEGGTLYPIEKMLDLFISSSVPATGGDEVEKASILNNKDTGDGTGREAASRGCPGNAAVET